MRGLEINLIALRTLFLKEVRRFSKVWLQTILSPLVTTSLYFLVFGLALGSRLRTVSGVPYMEFVVPGLMMLSMINAAFLNASSSLFQSKIHRTYLDLLTAPIGAAEMIIAFVGASVLRALLVGSLVWGVAVVFTDVRIVHPGWTLFFAVAVSAAFACVGLISAIFAEKFDHLAILPNFVLTPLTFLGGVFYSIDMLPEPWATVSRFNPLLYTVNGLRFGLLGISDVPIAPSGWATLGLLVLLIGASAYILGKGIKLRT
ncbi:MAG: ABC transporter permease [Myxococcota bacterium]